MSSKQLVINVWLVFTLGGSELLHCSPPTPRVSVSRLYVDAPVFVPRAAETSMVNQVFKAQVQQKLADEANKKSKETERANLDLQKQVLSLRKNADKNTHDNEGDSATITANRNMSLQVKLKKMMLDNLALFSDIPFTCGECKRNNAALESILAINDKKQMAKLLEEVLKKKNK